MPAFKILDELNTSSRHQQRKQSGLGKYLPDSVTTLLALRPIAKSLQKPLSESPTNPVALEFSPPDPIPLGAWRRPGCSRRASVLRSGVHHPDELLFPADDLRDAISVPSGTAYVSLSLSPRVKAQFEAERGALAFGFAAGTSIGLRYYHPFDVAGSDPTLARALTETIQQAVLPADVDDLAALPIGSLRVGRRRGRGPADRLGRARERRQSARHPGICR